MITVPFGLAAAIYAMRLTGGSFNYFSQIGLVLLIGIMAKNGILIVEFANQLRDRGLTIRQAIEEASLTRLRPVLMTALASVLGAFPRPCSRRRRRIARRPRLGGDRRPRLCNRLHAVPYAGGLPSARAVRKAARRRSRGRRERAR